MIHTSEQCTKTDSCICDICYVENTSPITGLPYDVIRATRRQKLEEKTLNNIKLTTERSNRENVEKLSLSEATLWTIAISIHKALPKPETEGYYDALNSVVSKILDRCVVLATGLESYSIGEEEG